MENGSAIVKTEAKLSNRIEFTAEQQKMIRDTFLGGASQSDAMVLMEAAKTRGLNPITRQIHFISRGGKWAIQISIDGLRALAERTGLYAGQTPVQWCGPDGKWVDVWLKKEPPAAAKVGVYRSGFKEPMWAVARFDSYSVGTSLWTKMPDLMIAKCAEALALRKAFPEETSGLYTDDEMAQADKGAKHVEQDITVKVAEKVRLVESSPAPTPPPEVQAKIDSAAEVLDGEVIIQTIEEARAISEKPMDLFTFRVGKHKGRSITEVPSSYLEWLRGSCKDGVENGTSKDAKRDVELAKLCDTELARRESK